jgi:hypothetical protein
MKPLILFLSFGVILFSCKTDPEKLPGNILQPRQMQEVLWDMIRADLFVRDYVTPDSVKKEKSISIYQQILDIHHTNKEQFKESFAYYRAHPGSFKPILDSLEKQAIPQTPTEIKPVIDTTKKFRVFKKADTLVAQ